MESYTAPDGTTRYRMTAAEKKERGIPTQAEVEAKATNDELMARITAADQARAAAQAAAPKKAQAGGAIDSFLAGAIGDTSHSHPGLAQGGANMAGKLARDATIIGAIAVVAICLLRFLARLLRERNAKKARLQKHEDDWTALEKKFHTGPVEERGAVVKEMREIVDNYVADTNTTYEQIEASQAARAAAGEPVYVSRYIDSSHLDGLNRKDLVRLARQVGLSVRGTDTTLKRNIAAEQVRRGERHAAAPERLDDVAIGLWKSFANTSAGRRLGGWWAKFLRDE